MMRRVLRKLQYAPHVPYPYAPPSQAPSGSYDSAAVAAASNPNNGRNNIAGYGRSKPLMQRSPRFFLDPVAFVEHVPRNTILNIVPQGRQYVVERLGRYHRTLDPGWWFVVPFIDRIRYCYSVKEQGIEIPSQSAITSDNVMVEIDGVLFLRIVDAQKASYNIENPVYNLLNLAQTTMRSEIGRLDLDTLFRERTHLNKGIVDVLRHEAHDWGIECKRYEIRDITVSELVRRSMDLQADAERRKRQLVLQSEGEAQAEINRAEGLKEAQRCAAEAHKYTIVQRAEAEAQATNVMADAVAKSVTVVAGSFDKSPRSNDAIALRVAEKYIEKFGELAKSTNTVVLGQNVGDPAAFSAQALAIFNSVNAGISGGRSGGSGSAGSSSASDTCGGGNPHTITTTTTSTPK